MFALSHNQLLFHLSAPKIFAFSKPLSEIPFLLLNSKIYITSEMLDMVSGRSSSLSKINNREDYAISLCALATRIRKEHENLARWLINCINIRNLNYQIRALGKHWDRKSQYTCFPSISQLVLYKRYSSNDVFNYHEMNKTMKNIAC